MGLSTLLPRLRRAELSPGCGIVKIPAPRKAWAKRSTPTGRRSWAWQGATLRPPSGRPSRHPEIALPYDTFSWEASSSELRGTTGWQPRRPTRRRSALADVDVHHRQAALGWVFVPSGPASVRRARHPRRARSGGCPTSGAVFSLTAPTWNPVRQSRGPWVGGADAARLDEPARRGVQRRPRCGAGGGISHAPRRRPARRGTAGPWEGARPRR